MENDSRAIFKKGSTTFFTSSLLFSKDILRDVADFYAFVRVVDDFVDSIPPNSQKYFSFKTDYEAAVRGAESENSVIRNFVNFRNRYNIPDEWVHGFFASMEMDIAQNPYQTIDDVSEYIYGSAEVIGLVMARILRLPKESEPFAQKLGKAFQYINFLRDIEEDIGLGRQYIPESIVREFLGVGVITKNIAYEKPDLFSRMMRQEIDRYRGWQNEARPGFEFILFRSRLAVAVAARLFEYTASIIYDDPHVVFRKKVKPTKLRIVMTVLTEFFRI